MSNMNWVVHTETHSQDNVDTADDVNGDAPEVEEANYVHQGEDHSQEDSEGDLDIGEQDQDHGEDGAQG